MVDKDKSAEKEAKATKRAKAPADGASKKAASGAKRTAASKAKARVRKVAKAGGRKRPPTKKAATDRKAQAPRAPRVLGTRYFAAGSLPEKWHLVDATGLTLGRISSHVVRLLMGKHKPEYTPNADTGDHVVVINAEKVHLTGQKWDQKKYYHHSNYPGGIKEVGVRDLRDGAHPERIIQWAVWGMLPKSKGHLVRHWYKKLRVYKGTTHPHTAQNPVPAVLPNLGIHQ
jgi:large subunit ribosomal protein L13